MNELEKFYKKSFLTANIVDRCIHCHKHNTVQLIVQMEIVVFDTLFKTLEEFSKNYMKKKPLELRAATPKVKVYY